MALNRIVRWQDTVPTTDEIATVLEDYIGEGIGSVQWDKESHWYVFLHGKSSHPQQRLLPVGPAVTMREQRDFEVILGTNYMVIFTDDQSPLVQAIADGFVKFAITFWNGKLADNWDI